MKVLASGIFFLTFLGFAACSSSETPSANPPDATVVDSADPPNDSNRIPCGPRAVLETVCQQCHSNPQMNGAPFPLVTYSNILIDRGQGITRDLMIAQLVAHRMPLPPATITDDQRTTLLAWLQAGAAPVVAQDCADAGSNADSGDEDAADAADAAFADDADGGGDAADD